jgi:hypothetical protein
MSKPATADTTGSASRDGGSNRSGVSAASFPARRRRFCLLLAAGWCALLACLVLTTANPVTLNRRQILEADAVVTAQVLDSATGRCRIVNTWSGTALPDDTLVAHLDETAATPGGEWILPLAKRGDGFEVLPSRLPSGARLVYPATPEAVRQLEEILTDGR